VSIFFDAMDVCRDAVTVSQRAIDVWQRAMGVPACAIETTRRLTLAIRSTEL
jgi:hypothetical protein